MILSALREANGKLIATDEIASQALAAKGNDAADAIMRGAVRNQSLSILRMYRKRGTVEQTGLGRGVRWKMAKSELDFVRD